MLLIYIKIFKYGLQDNKIATTIIFLLTICTIVIAWLLKIKKEKYDLCIQDKNIKDEYDYSIKNGKIINGVYVSYPEISSGLSWVL